MYIYYPSCNFRKRLPEAAAKVEAYMKTQPDVVIAGCCHLTNDLPKEGDTIVTVCLSCMRTLDELRSDIPQISLYEFLLTRKDLVFPDYEGEEITLQDCFRARGKHELHEAVRECLRRMNFTIREMELSRDEAEYDGSFRLHAPYPQNLREAPKYYGEYLPQYLTILPKEEWPDVYKKQVDLITTKRVAGYCNVCVPSLKEAGADAVHVADLIFS